MRTVAGFRKTLLGTACVMGLLITAQAQGQVANYYDNNVIVDLSVIDDNGLGNKRPSVSSPLSNAKLPPVQMPKSTFHGLPKGLQPSTVTPAASQLNVPGSDKPQSRIVLRKPTMNTTKPALPTSKLASSNKIELKKPAMAAAPAPKKVEVAKSAPKAMVKPPAAPKAAEAPKPVAAPTKPVEVVKKEMTPAPKPMAKKEVKPTPPPAPPAKVMAEAPPPPPPAIVEPKKVEAAMKKEEKKPVTTTAAIPPSADAAVRIAFDEGQSKMPSASKGNLDQLAETLRKQPDDRVQLLAYAGGENLTASKARRLSLSRALAVRSYLIGKGVRSTRIDVRALGNKTTQDPVDRVDVQVTPR